MTGGIGAFLKELRQSRRISLKQLAAQTHLAPRTLSYWESNTYQPRLPELEAVLKALGVSGAQREQALALVVAPRAVLRLRAEPRIARLQEQIGPLPSGGDLLRAMRHRRRLYLEQVAEALGVSPGTVSRWEQGQVVPPPESLEALLTRLGARPEERAVLMEGHLFLVPPLRAIAISVEALRERFLGFVWSSYDNRADPLHDLRFLTLAAEAWTFAARSRHGRDLLADIYAHYASYLSDLHRFAEARAYAERALDFLVDKSAPEVFYIRAAIAWANAAVLRGPKPAPQPGLALLNLWQPVTRKSDYRAWMLEDMARYLAMMGEIPEALRLSEKACRVAETHENPDELRLRRLGLAKLHLRAGNVETALTLAPLFPKDGPFRRADVLLLWVEGMLATGDRSSAQDWLQRALADIEAHDLIHLRSRADALTRHF
ncbi:MAG TPA: helix-turn-helix transcriptional regulator [Chthonomonadaceae bacterium]|nr:helix-turn-helix transcriptional regulator [Chthonomonadaceae bacterium]